MAAVILYDRDCGFCRRSLARILDRDRHGRLRPVALQDPEAEVLLPRMEEERRLASWHLVTDDGVVHSGGAAAGPLLRLLPHGRPAARVLERFPRATDRVYRWVARNRGPLGRVL